MARPEWGLPILLCIVTVAGALGIVLLGHDPARPRNVPADAVLVGGGTIRVWQHCSYEAKEDVNRCQVFNVGGEVISDGVFLPYDGGKAATPAELTVENETRFKGIYYVCLKNGRILIAKSDFENQKKYLDEIGAR